MGSIYNTRIVGWTTNEDAANGCRELGLEVTGGYNVTGPRGWEIVAHPDPPEVVYAAEATEGMEA